MKKQLIIFVALENGLDESKAFLNMNIIQERERERERNSITIP